LSHRKVNPATHYMEQKERKAQKGKGRKMEGGPNKMEMDKTKRVSDATLKRTAWHYRDHASTRKRGTINY